jgi:hypothetical protein
VGEGEKIYQVMNSNFKYAPDSLLVTTSFAFNKVIFDASVFDHCRRITKAGP